MASRFEQSSPSTSSAPLFAGAILDQKRDEPRLHKQLDCILAVVIDGKPRTIDRLVAELVRAYPDVHFPANSVQAQLRNLKKIGYGLHKRNIAKRGFLCEYTITPRKDAA